MLSIVMPVYNTSPGLLERSVGSLTAQTCRNTEIILVNDGSREETVLKLEELADKDSRIRVIHQKNQGVSAARNTGILAARGRYLTMMDSDDEIAPEAYEQIIRKLKKSGADAAVFGFREARADRTVLCHSPIEGHKDALEKPERILPVIILSAVKRGGGYPWNKVWDLQRIGKAALFEPRIICYEDKLWCVQMYQKCRKVLLLPEIYYTYYENSGSLSRGDALGRKEAVKKRRSALEAYDHILKALPGNSAAYYAAAAFRLKTIIMGVLKRTI